MKLCQICQKRGKRVENPTLGHLLGHGAAGKRKTMTPAAMTQRKRAARQPRKTGSDNGQNGQRNGQEK